MMGHDGSSFQLKFLDAFGASLPNRLRGRFVPDMIFSGR